MSSSPKLAACSKCGIYEPSESLSDGICLECIKLSKTPLREPPKEPIPTAYFLGGAFASFWVGYILIEDFDLMIGGFFVLTLMPILILYPIIRYLLGGRDSDEAAIGTLAVYALIRLLISNAANKHSKRR